MLSSKLFLQLIMDSRRGRHGVVIQSVAVIATVVGLSATRGND